MKRLFLRNFFLHSILLVLPLLCGSQKAPDISDIINSEVSFDLKTEKIDSVIKVMHHKMIDDGEDQFIISYLRWLYRKKKFFKGIKVVQVDLVAKKDLPVLDTLSLQTKLRYLGLSYYKTNQYNKSIDAFERVIALNGENSICARTYTSLGRCYAKKGDFYTAIEQYELGQYLLIKNKNYGSLLASYINTSQSYTDLGTLHSFKKSRYCLQRADSLSGHIPVSNLYKYYINIGLGKTFNEEETLDIDQAKHHYQKALEIAQKDKDSSKISESYNHLGNIYNTTNPDLGITYQEMAIINTPTNDSLRFHVNHVNIGFCKALIGSYDEGIVHFYKALSFLIATDVESIMNKLGIELLYDTPNKEYVLTILKHLANTYFKQYKELKDPYILERAIQTFVIADELIDLIQIESKEFKSKLYWRKQSEELYGRAIESCFLANDTDKAFYFMEKNKALLLTENLKKAQLLQSLSLPDSLINKEIELKKKIYTLKKQKQSIENKDSIALVLLDEQRNLQNLQKSIQNSFSDYIALDFKTSLLNLKELQDSLDENTSVIEYNISMYNDHNLITSHNNYTPVIKGCKYGVKTLYPSYGFLITKNTVDFFKLKDGETLKRDLEILLSKMSKPHRTEEEIGDYNQIANIVFKRLFPSEKIREVIKNKKLRVIPDNYLNYLSFEALVTSTDLITPATYLLEQIEISYAYSNSFLSSINTSNKGTGNSFLAFAPGKFDNPELTTLLDTEKEIQTIGNYFKGVTYTQNEATKERFMTAFPNYDIIHLATHANAQDSISPWITFRKNKLLEDELYLTTSKAKMVVLSGCNTLLGKQEIGEGVMSLARGFFYSGAESVVSSLWNVNDQSTSYIMNEFYKNLSNNQSKSEALRNAKLSYIDTHFLVETSPSYWASLVLLGDSSALNESSYSKYWWFVILILFFLSYFVYKKSKNS